MSRRLAHLFLTVLIAIWTVCPVLPLTAQTAATEPPAGEGGIDFNFDQVEISIIARLVSEVTGKRFMLDESAAGRISIVTPTRIKPSEVFDFFVSVLESANFSVAEKGGVYTIVKLPARPVAGGPVATETREDSAGIITRIFKLTHISALELKKILVPMVRAGGEGALQAFGSTNHLIITDTSENIRRMEEIIRELDQPGMASITEVIQLQHGSAEEIAAQLNMAMLGGASAGEKLSRHMAQVTEGGGSLPTAASVIPLPNSNRLILVGTQIQINELKGLILEMDVEPRTDGGRLNAIFLKYLPAEDAAKNLNALLERSAAGKTQPRSITIEPSVANNALIVEASPQDFEVVKVLVEKLDKIPQQVLVEILVAEVSTGKALDLGVELSTVEEVDDDPLTVVAGRSRPGAADTLAGVLTNMIPQGLTFAVAQGTVSDLTGAIIPNVPFLIRALAQDREVEILANVPLWAQNNREASVSVVENIPILTSTIEGTGDARDVIQNIERIDVGIQLTVTPQVNADGNILLKLNPIIEAVVNSGPSDSGLAPTIAKREVSTTVTIPDKATVVISGLIREDTIESESRVPILGSLPLIGWLFRSTSNSKQRNNLLIFVTPTIVTDLEDAAAVQADLEEKSGITFPTGKTEEDSSDDDGGAEE